jgi:hypothetical protein
MNTIILKVTTAILTLFIIQLGYVQYASAQCVACYQSKDGTCTTELVNRNGADGCGCDTGCNCSGTCEYFGEAFNLDDIDELTSDLPSTGLMASTETEKLDNFLTDFRHKGVVGNKTVSNIWFNDDIAIYRLNQSDFMIYPVRDNKIELKSCSGEHLATIMDKSAI